MSEEFNPEEGAAPDSTWTTVFLSQRDLGLQIPINFVTQPGVSFSAACFAHQRYEDDESGKCLSNLLVEGFRRFEIDLYWDEGRRIWTFCPVAIPTDLPSVAPFSTATLSFSSSTIANAPLTSAVSSTNPPASVSTSLHSASGLGARQETSNAVATSTPNSSPTISGSSLGTSLPTVPVLPGSDDPALYQIGPYVCTATINLSTFISQILDYIQNTQTTLSAHLIYVIMNLHAAASESAPASPAPQPLILPSASELLGTLWSSNVSSYLYTPNNLREDRANLNGSWYTVASRYRPVEDYYTVKQGANDVSMTDDGWPSESYIEFSKSKRLLLGVGTVDPQMEAYNFTGDDATLFPQGYIQKTQDEVTTDSSGRLTKGCNLLNATDELSAVNSSWSTTMNVSGFSYPTAADDSLGPLLNLTSNATNCGISSVLNVTLLDVTAYKDFASYRNFSYSTIWSWASGEPKNFSSDTSDTDAIYSCATTNLELAGHWVVEDCSQKLYASCRADKQPYNWTITTYEISYTFADEACPDSYTFAAPRTALENAYLNQAMRESRLDFNEKGAWVDFNSLDVEGCWVTGGPNATCPYSATVADADDLKRKTVLVPTVAALIVLVVTILTVFAKVAGNRRTKRRRNKRALNGFVYEGVPS